MDRAKRLIRRLRGKKKYVSSPTGSLPPSPMPGSPIPGENKNRTGIKLRRGKSLNLNKMWRRCIYFLNSIVHDNNLKRKLPEISSWFLLLLISRSCPAHLEAGLTRAVLDEARVNYLSQNTASMSPTGTAIDVSDGKKNEKCASTDDLQSAHPSLSSTKGSQGKIPIAVFMHLQQSNRNDRNITIATLL